MRKRVRLFVGAILPVALAVSIACLRSSGLGDPQGNPIFTYTTIDVGCVLRASTVECEFPFRSDAQIDRSELITICSCGCLEAKESNSDRRAEALSIVYTAPRRLGPFQKECYVRRGADTTAVLAIKGTIVSEIELLPNQLVFDLLAEGDAVGQPLRIRRVGLSKEEFHAISFRIASPAITVAEISRSDDEILLHCSAKSTIPAEIQLGFYCELNSAEGKKTVAQVPCKYHGPVLRPSAAVFRAEARQSDERHVFRLIGDRSWRIRRLHLDSDVGEPLLDVAFENDAREGPAVTITVPKDSQIPVSVHQVHVFYADLGGGDERCISLPVTFF